MAPFSVLVLGGYGLFGGRIVRRLARIPDWRIVVAGRDAARAERFCAGLPVGASAATLQALALNAQGGDLTPLLRREAVNLVINACGPFQQQDYRIAEAAVAAGAHYLDLADARAFVCGVTALDARARERDCLVVSGASTVPGLSAAVVEQLRPQFSRLDAVATGISPGNRSPRGLATVAAILSYVGRPFTWREHGINRAVHGWQRLQRHTYSAPVGPRWLAACDVPDLELLPALYPELRTATFRAGLELKRLHFGLWLASWLARARLVDNWSRHAAPLKRASTWFEHAGSDAGAMFVTLRGRDASGKPLRIDWELIARAGDGPEIPCTASVLLAKKLYKGTLIQRGARPCIGLFTLAEFQAELDGYAIATTVTRC